MEEDYNWTRDGEIIQKAMSEIWEPFAFKYEMKVEYHSIESNKLKSMTLTKGDLMIDISMSRTNPFNCSFFSITRACEDNFVYFIFKGYIPKGENLIWLYNQNNLLIPDDIEDKKQRWTQWMSNYVFLLEKYCSELLETGDICGWLAKHPPKE